MLTSLYVKDFAIAHALEFSPQSGLTVVSGETGAGKSLLVDALMLLTGARADASLVRHGAERAELSASFSLNTSPEAENWLRDAALDEGQECQLRRVIRADGGSRAFINGRPATVSQLAELGGRLIEIHGQHEHQALLERQHQLHLLDAFAQHPSDLEALREQTRLWQAAQREITLLTQLGDTQERRNFLAWQLEELKRDALAPDAIEQLIAEHRRQSHAMTLIEGCTRVAEVLEGDHGTSLPHLLHRVRQDLARLVRHDARLNDIDALLDSAAIQIDEAAALLTQLRDEIDPDPERLNRLDAQLSRLHELARKHRTTPEELLACQQRLQEEFDTLDSSEARLAALQKQSDAAFAEWKTIASRVSDQRQKTATQLSHTVSQLMEELGMTGGRFVVELIPASQETPHPNGAEQVEFLVSANSGQPPRPLRKVASGGELSRISLAIEVAALDLEAVATMVFDEVDTGIGGAVAEVVGQKLRALGNQRQVLCVTHLPQVAAQGHHHLFVSKADDGNGTRSQLEILNTKERIEELARMLGGVEITDTTLAHARQMLEHGQRS